MQTDIRIISYDEPPWFTSLKDMKRFLTASVVITLMLGYLMFYATMKIDAGSLSKTSLAYELFKELVKYYIQLVFIALAGSLIIQEYNRGMQLRTEMKQKIKNINNVIYDIYRY